MLRALSQGEQSRIPRRRAASAPDIITGVSEAAFTGVPEKTFTGFPENNLVAVASVSPCRCLDQLRSNQGGEPGGGAPGT